MRHKFFIYIDKKLEMLGLINLFTIKYIILTHIRQKRGLKCPLKNVYSMYKYSSYASCIASNTAAPLLTSYGKEVALSSNVML